MRVYNTCHRLAIRSQLQLLQVLMSSSGMLHRVMPSRAERLCFTTWILDAPSVRSRRLSSPDGGVHHAIVQVAGGHISSTV